MNLKRRPDRRARMEALLSPHVEPIFTSDWDGPFDGHHLTAEALRPFGLFPWQIESANHWWSRPLKTGEVGCALSHWRCWTAAAARGDRAALFFEDDVVFSGPGAAGLEAHIARVERVEPAWDLVYFGRLRLDVGTTPLGKDVPVCEGLVRPGYSHCAHAYALSRAGLAKLLSVGFERDIIPVDEFLPALYTIHPRADVARRYRPVLNAVALDPSVAFQLPKDEAGSDTEASAFVDW